MTKVQYRDFIRFVLGLNNETWENCRTESTFRNMILQDLDALLYYFDMDDFVQGNPYSTSGDLANIAKILAHLMLILVGADACTPYIINKVWGKMKLRDKLSAGLMATSLSFAGEY